MSDLIIVGAGGHSRAVISAALFSKNWNIIGVIDNNFQEEENILGIPCIGKLDKINSFSNKNTKVFIAIGDYKIRKSIYSETSINKFDHISIIHPSAIIDNSSKIGVSNFIGPFANIGPNVSIGSFNVINTYCNIEHESKIGNFNDISPGTMICGRCKIGNQISIGANATIIDKISIEDENIIGAGSVIIQDIVTKGKTYVGIPGKAL